MLSVYATEAGLAKERLPLIAATQVEAEFRASKFLRRARVGRLHDSEATPAHNAADFDERDDRIAPEMDHTDCENAVNSGVGERDVLGGGEM